MSEQTDGTDSGIDSRLDAICALRDHSGSTILYAKDARAIAAQFGVELNESVRELQPIKRMDRLQPSNDQLGIGVGSLCYRIAEELDGVEAEDFNAGGHGYTQRGLKRENLSKLESQVTGDTNE